MNEACAGGEKTCRDGKALYVPSQIPLDARTARAKKNQFKKLQ